MRSLLPLTPQSHFLIAVITVITTLTTTTCLAKTPPANFVFGDSLVDAGNNDYIVSLSKANYAPNGIDFGYPTGRYTNGRTIVDIIGQELGFKGFTPPYLAPTTTGEALLQGVNYASGGGGILNYTGKIFGGRINLDAQLDNFANTRREIAARIGTEAAAKLIENAIFSVTIGSNDFINNYLQKPQISSPEEFVGALIARYRTQLTRLHSMGARYVLVANVGPIGCIPFQRELDPSAGSGCASFPNQIARLYNGQLRGLVRELNSSLRGSKLVYADVYRIVDDIIQNYRSYGFDNGDSACCHLAGRFGGLIPCGPTSRVCGDRSKYVFWDAYHPADAANSIIADRLLNGGPADIWPVNLRQLLA